MLSVQILSPSRGHRQAFTEIIRRIAVNDTAKEVHVAPSVVSLATKATQQQASMARLTREAGQTGCLSPRFSTNALIRFFAVR